MIQPLIAATLVLGCVASLAAGISAPTKTAKLSLSHTDGEPMPPFPQGPSQPLIVAYEKAPLPILLKDGEPMPPFPGPHQSIAVI